jgi:hypothetical protein
MGVAEIGSISRPESWLLPCLLGFGFGGDRHGVFLAFRLDLPEASCREIPIVGVQVQLVALRNEILLIAYL